MRLVQYCRSILIGSIRRANHRDYYCSTDGWVRIRMYVSIHVLLLDGSTTTISAITTFRRRSATKIERPRPLQFPTILCFQRQARFHEFRIDPATASAPRSPRRRLPRKGATRVSTHALVSGAGYMYTKSRACNGKPTDYA